ncbi:MAG: tetratricopeptide repeat protein [Leptospiraceae bacterium]|nr:tetratricopeptide repeat protein [Leptospiraceae bacterium]
MYLLYNRFFFPCFRSGSIFRISFFLVFLFTTIHADGIDKKQYRCEYTPENGESEEVYPDFYLSLALNSQSLGLRARKQADKEIAHKEAIKHFDAYISCLNSINFSVSALTYFNRGLSYYELRDWDKVSENLDLALDQDSRLRDAVYLKARILLKNKKKEEAMKLLEDSISFFDQDSDILFTLGGVSAELNLYSKALLYFGSLWNNIQKREGDIRYRPYVLKNMADLHSKKGDLTRSIYYLKQYLKFRPTDEDSSFQLANLYSQTGNFKEARIILQDLQEKNPRNNMYYYLMAEIYFIENRNEAHRYFSFLNEKGILQKNKYLTQLYKVLQGKYPEVKPYFEDLALKSRNRLTIYISLAYIYNRLGPDEGYTESLKRASMIAQAYKQQNLSILYSKKFIEIAKKKKEFEKDIPMQLNYISSCYEELNSPHLALLNVREAIRLTKDEKEKNLFQLHEANILRSPGLKRYKESIQLLHGILDSEPDMAAVYHSLGLSYFVMEKYRESVDYFTRAIELDDKNPSYYYFRANAYEKIGYMEDTIVDLKKIMELDPGNSLSYNYLGYLYAEKNIELEESLKLIRKALDLEPDNAAYQDSLGWVYYRFEKYEEALHHLQLARQLMEEKKEEDPTVYDHLGDVHLKLNEANSARENWDRAILLFKDKKDQMKVKEKLKKLNKNPKP